MADDSTRLEQPRDDNPTSATDEAVALAKKEGVELSTVPGSGADGRVLKGDVEAFVAEASKALEDGVEITMQREAVVEGEPHGGGTSASKWRLPRTMRLVVSSKRKPTAPVSEVDLSISPAAAAELVASGDAVVSSRP